MGSDIWLSTTQARLASLKRFGGREREKEEIGGVIPNCIAAAALPVRSLVLSVLKVEQMCLEGKMSGMREYLKRERPRERRYICW